MSDLMLDVDQAGELKAAFRRGNWSNAEIKKLSTGDILIKVRNVLLGLSEIHPISHTINLDTTPFLPEGWKGVEEHRKGGIAKLERNGDDLYINGKKIDFYLSEKQKKGSFSTGTDLRKELANQQVLNANVLDYLLKPENQHLIPDSWKGKYIFFWGTIYRAANLNLCVRYLYWRGRRWDWYCSWLGYDFYDYNPAAVSAS